jgi:hypothetical protein
MDSTVRMLIDATAHINASSADERVRSIRTLVDAVNRITSLSPEEQVATLTEVHKNVQELKGRVEAATAEYEEARLWLKVLEGVVRQVDTGPTAAAERTPPVEGQTADGSATVLAEKPDVSRGVAGP